MIVCDICEKEIIGESKIIFKTNSNDPRYLNINGTWDFCAECFGDIQEKLIEYMDEKGLKISRKNKKKTAAVKNKRGTK